MEANKKYITQITSADLRELAALTHLEAGDGLTISYTSNGVRFDIDYAKLTGMLNNLGIAADAVQQGGNA